MKDGDVKGHLRGQVDIKIVDVMHRWFGPNEVVLEVQGQTIRAERSEVVELDLDINISPRTTEVSL